ncbi:MAG TPA: flagellar filament capping protein FliD, partial [Gemmatimonadales bacterium]|nr:flagellar filament capping protein FliD [Gemmatimonadales bacterium]
SKTGELTFDETRFGAAHAGSFENLRALFTAGSGAIDLDGTLDAALALNTGSIDLKSRFLTDRVMQLQERIDRIESRLDRKRTMLLQQFAQMESTLGALQSQSSFIASQASGFNRTTR